MPRVAWTLTDNSTGSPVVMNFDVNPNKFSPPGRKSTLSAETTVAPSGQVILFQGRDEVRRATLSGAVLTETFYNTLNTWKDKFYPLVLTDDEGTAWNIIIESWEWERIRVTNPWRYDYSAQVIVL